THGDDGDAHPQDRALGELARRQWTGAGARVVLDDDEGGGVFDLLLRKLALPRGHDATAVGPPVGDDADQVGRVQRVGGAGQLLDRVEDRADAPLEAGAVADRAVLRVDGRPVV